MSFTQGLFIVRRVGKNLRELFWTHALTVAAMAMSLFIFGGFVLVQGNLQGLLKGWESRVQIFAYLEDSPAPAEVEPLLEQIRSISEVESVRFVSKAEAWEDFKKALGSQSGVLEGLSADILPSSLEIALKGPYRDRASVDRVARKVRALERVSEVEYPQEWIEKLSFLALGIQWARWVLGGFLFVATLLIVGSTVRLAIVARRDEIEIMQLVGAPPALVRAPFVVEGMVQGAVASALAIGLLWLAFAFVGARLSTSFWIFAPPGELFFLGAGEISLLFFLGLGMGAAGSLLSLRRFLGRNERVADLRIAVIVLVLFLDSILQAAEVQKELEGLRKKIERERQRISRVARKEESVLQSLAKVEQDLEEKNRELKRLSLRLEANLGELQRKEKEAEKIESSLKRRRELLKNRARALYKWHRTGSPFVLLSGGTSVAELMQRRRYLELTLAYDRRLVSALLEESRRQRELRTELARKRENLDAERKRLTEVKESIRLEREKKKEILARLRREKEARVQALKELEQAALRLEKMMDELGRKSAGPTRAPGAGVAFEELWGKLDYPVRGAIAAAFGKTRHPEFSAEVFRKGIDFEAPLGEEIRSVAPGKVVFADRFSGYGKMIIVDHGDRYYTIYAHLSELLKKVGDVIQTGEPIGLVGDSDSLGGARLYFEIRKGGKPLNPLPWFSKR